MNTCTSPGTRNLVSAHEVPNGTLLQYPSLNGPVYRMKFSLDGGGYILNLDDGSTQNANMTKQYTAVDTVTITKAS